MGFCEEFGHGATLFDAASTSRIRLAA